MLPPDQIRAVVENYVRAFNTVDRELYLSLFAPDGTVEDPIGGPPIRGHDALGAFFDAATGGTRVQLQVDPADVRVSGNHVAFRFTLRVDAGGSALGMQPIDTFEFDADGRITAMRAYWSPTDFRPVP